MIDVSIILYTNNKKTNFKRCLDSLVNQTNRNIEILVLCNDNEYETIVESYNDDRIIYTCSSESIEDMINNSLKKIHGKYVYFISEDDYLRKNAIESVVERLKKKKVDILVTNYYRRVNKKNKKLNILSFMDTSLKKKNVLKDVNLSLYNKFFCRKTLKHNKIKISLDDKNEEESFLLKCDTIGKLDKAVVYHTSNDKREKKKDIKTSIIITIAFLALFLVGLFSLRNVGVYFDEDSEKDILRMNIIDYAETLKVGRSYAANLRGMGLIPISESVERDHGVAPYYPYVLIMDAFDGNLNSVTWHLYTYILCFLGVIFLYFILKRILKNKYLSLLVASLYFLSPRIFADSLYNNKDMILLTLLIMSIYFGIRLIEKKDYKNAIILGIVSAFMCNVKVLGIYFIGVIGLCYLFNIVLNREFTKRNFFIGITVILTWLITYVAITPAIWCGDSFQLIEHIKWGLEQSSNFTRLRPTVYFEGIYHVRSVNPLPWYYIPKMIAITTPLVVTVPFVFSVVLMFINVIKNLKNKIKIDLRFLIVIMAFVLFIVPFAISIFSKPNVYNGWRHFYFLYGLIILIAAYGLCFIERFSKVRKIVNCFLVIVVLYYFVSNMINGVGGMSYYNILVNNNNPVRYETDYYGVMTKASLENVLDLLDDDEIYVYSKEGTSAQASLYATVGKLKEEDSKRVKVVATNDEYEKLKEEGKRVLYFYNTNYNKKDEIKGMDEIYTYNAWETVINGFYE